MSIRRNTICIHTQRCSQTAHGYLLRHQLVQLPGPRTLSASLHSRLGKPDFFWTRLYLATGPP